MLAQLLLWSMIAGQAQAAAPPRDAATPQAGSGAIAGQITEQGSDRPLSRALVTLTSSAGGATREALTDAEGHYEFTGLSAGDYGVLAAPGELRATHLRQAFNRPSPLEPLNSPPRSGVPLKAGERRADVNIALARALALEGRVLDPGDEPMSDVGVMLMRADGTHYPGNAAYSDDRGDYRLFGLAPGRYRVCATPQGSTEAESEKSRFIQTCHPAAIAASDAADIIVTTGDVSGIDIHVQRGGTLTLSGSVIDAAGTVVDSPWVGADPFDRRFDPRSTIGRAGRFVLGGLMPGRYVIQASVGGVSDLDDPRTPTREREVGYTSVDVGASDVGDVVIALSKPQTVRGRVVFEGGSPPRPSQLRMSVRTHAASMVSAGLFAERPPIAAVDDQLGFELGGLYQLPLVIAVTGVPDGWAVKSVRYDGRDITNVATNFGASSKPGRLEIVATNRVAQPAVRVADERSEPPSPFYVLLFSTDPARWQGAPVSIPGPSSGAGEVKLGAVLPGDYYLVALAMDDLGVLMNDVTRFADLATVATRVTFGERDTPTLDLHVTRLPATRR